MHSNELLNPSARGGHLAAAEVESSVLCVGKISSEIAKSLREEARREGISPNQFQAWFERRLDQIKREGSRNAI